MATKEAIGIKREKAMDRIKRDVSLLIDQFQLEATQFELEPFDHDPDLKHAMQLEGFANFLQAVALSSLVTKKAASKEIKDLREKVQELEASLHALQPPSDPGQPQS